MADPVVLLHGFGGTLRAWDPVLERLRARAVLALDLRGHGHARGRRPADLEGCVKDVLRQAPARFALCGYSLGGRVALHVALAAPERVSELVLVATTAGIEDDEERAARAAADAALADEIAGLDAAAFADRWMAQPIFAGTPPEAAATWREDLLRNEPESLAAALRGMGAGAMAPLWERLEELAMPATVVVGERDAKYVALGERLAAGLPDARLVVVPDAGHGLPREAPGAIAEVLEP